VVARLGAGKIKKFEKKFEKGRQLELKLEKLQKSKHKCYHLNCSKVFTNSNNFNKHLQVQHRCGSQCNICRRTMY
jgi:hypothetical protein